MDLACKILDGAPFRDDISKPLSVQRAKFEMKGGEFVARKKPKKKPKKPGAKVDKMLGWGGFDDQLNPTKASLGCAHERSSTLPDGPTPADLGHCDGCMPVMLAVFTSAAACA